MNENLKQCSKCRNYKELNEYTKDNSRKDKLNHRCKSCIFSLKPKSKVYMLSIGLSPELKVCGSCFKTKSLNCFAKSKNGKNGIYSVCKSCKHEYYLKHKTIKTKQAKLNRIKNLEHYKTKANERSKIRRKTDPVFRLKANIYCNIRGLLKEGYKPNKNTENILGCTKYELIKHLESKFQYWMTWNNHGTLNGKKPTKIHECWDIDHIIPMKEAKTIEDVIRLNHYTNLQPLCSYENRWIKANEK